MRPSAIEVSGVGPWPAPAFRTSVIHVHVSSMQSRSSMQLQGRIWPTMSPDKGTRIALSYSRRLLVQCTISWYLVGESYHLQGTEKVVFPEALQYFVKLSIRREGEKDRSGEAPSCASSDIHGKGTRITSGKIGQPGRRSGHRCSPRPSS